MRPDEALLRVLALTGLSLPRGVLGPETWALARALSGAAVALSAVMAFTLAGIQRFPEPVG